jgi:hypothetical protein
MEEKNEIVEITNELQKAHISTPTNEELLKMFEEKRIIEPYVGTYISGTIIEQGRYAKQEKNPIIIIDNIYYILCNKNAICKLDNMSYTNLQKIQDTLSKKMTYSLMNNGYIIENSTNLYIHQLITGHYGHGKGTINLSVDHIDRNRLNNCYDNLRIVDRKEQERNSKGIMDGTKRERKKTACELPNGLTQDMLPKYVVYYYENLTNGRHREFFKIEKHPKITKPVIGSKSMKISIFQKLDMIKSQLEELNKE